VELRQDSFIGDLASHEYPSPETPLSPQDDGV